MKFAASQRLRFILRCHAFAYIAAWDIIIVCAFSGWLDTAIAASLAFEYIPFAFLAACVMLTAFNLYDHLTWSA